MCHYIEAEYILIHKLKNNKTCTVSELVDLKDKIEAEIPNVFIDVSRESIEVTAIKFPNVFNYEEDIIEKKEGSEKYFTSPLISYFESKVKFEDKDTFLKILES